jgi:hypothetical protein
MLKDASAPDHEPRARRFFVIALKISDLPRNLPVQDVVRINVSA